MTLLLLVWLADEWAEFDRLSKDKDPEERCKAIDRIDKHRDARMVQALLPLLADEHARVRYRAMRAIGRCKAGPAAETAATKGLKHADARVRQGSAEALGWIKDRSIVPALLGTLADANADVRAEVCSALGWIRDDSAIPKLLDAFKDKEWKVRANALEAVVKMEASKAKEIVGAATTDKDYPVRMEAAKSWPLIDPAGAVEALSGLIRDKDWRVRCSAIEACSLLRERACIGWLVEFLEKEKGRLRWDALIALKDLTAKEIGLDVKAWKAWWEANKNSFQVVKKNGEDSGADVGKTTTSFFKVPIISTSLIFILDLSGSMRDKAVDGEGQPKGATKLDVAKKGMIEAIRAFPADTKFSIVALGSTKEGQYDKPAHTWQRKLALFPATPAVKADAEKWVNKCEAKGWTNIYDGIEYAFENPEVDTIYLYSDGGASKGVFVLTDEMLAHVQKLNRFRKVMIHTIEVPAEKANTRDNIRLLTELATKTKGVYRLHVAK